MTLMTMTNRDTEPTGKSRQTLAQEQEYAQNMQSSLGESHEQLTVLTIVIDAAPAVSGTAIMSGRR